MERIRDFLYDISDLLLSMLIISVIFLVISWKLNESIPIQSDDSQQSVATAQDLKEPSAETPPADTSEPADASDADKPIDTATQENPQDSSATTPTDTTPPAVDSGAAETTPETKTDVKTITVEIPAGSPGVAIGSILKKEGLISDVKQFIQKVDEMNLGPKLRSGTFKLQTDMSMEQIIKIIANVK